MRFPFHFLCNEDKKLTFSVESGKIRCFFISPRPHIDLKTVYCEYQDINKLLAPSACVPAMSQIYCKIPQCIVPLTSKLTSF